MRQRQMMQGAVGVMLCGSLAVAGCSRCSPGDATDRGAATVEAAPDAAPACSAQLTADGRLLIAGAQSGVRLDAATLELSSRPVARTFALGAHEVLVALAAPERAELGAALPPPDGRLWRVDCRRPAQPELVIELAGAELGHSQLLARTLFFTSPAGELARLEIDSRAWWPVLQPASLEDETRCWAAQPGLTTYDRVAGLDPSGTALIVERGGPCGYEADWTAHVVQVESSALLAVGAGDEPLAADDPRLVEPHGVTAIALDAGGTLWLGDGGRCDEPGVIDRATRGVVWRSDDGGAQWRAVPIEVEGGERPQASTAVRHVVADSARAGHVVVSTALCRNGGVGRYGGAAYVTEDGGETWRALALPEAVVGAPPVELGAGIVELRSSVPPSTQALEIEVVERGRFATPDGGRTWQARAESQPEPAPAARVTRAGVVFEARGDGLWRMEEGGAQAGAVRVFPPSPR